MGGVFSGGSGGYNNPVSEAAAKVAESGKKAEAEKATQATQAQEEAGARMRGSKRRGRQLLSDARLNAEMGMQETLGGGNSLG
jgi:hypothetical protein